MVLGRRQFSLAGAAGGRRVRVVKGGHSEVPMSLEAIDVPCVAAETSPLGRGVVAMTAGLALNLGDRQVIGSIAEAGVAGGSAPDPLAKPRDPFLGVARTAT